MALKQIESLLYRLITAPSGVGEGLAAEKKLPAGGLAGIILGDERLSADERVDIYANMYFYRLLDVLKEDFPATLAVLGAENFHNLATGYLLEHRPTEPSVLHLGRHLAEYLQRSTLAHAFRIEAPFIADLARLERATIDVFHAPDFPALDTAAMRAIPAARWPRLKMRLHPAVRILQCEWKVADVLTAVEAGREWTAPAHEKCNLLVWRHDSRSHCREMDSIESHALSLAERDASFAAICDVIVRATDDETKLVVLINTMLQRWIFDGVLTLSTGRRCAKNIAPKRRHT
ncbi:MAG TPA: DNA-binding domain-containing protein [Candidatus Binataceae bacterium]